MTIKLVAIDMDATLLRDDKTYEQETFELLLNRLSEMNIAVCIASGNSYHKLKEFFSEQALSQMDFASDNGNYLVEQNKVTRIVGIERAEFLAIADRFDQLGDVHVTISTGKVTYFRATSGPGFERVAKYNNDIRFIDSFEEIPEGEVSTKMAIYSPNSLAKNKVFARMIEDEFADISVVTSGDQWIDVYHVSGGKGSAIEYLQNQMAILPEETMAFGDSLNDETMMKQVAYNIAMGNSDVDLVLHCQYKIGTNEQQAVIGVLEQLVLDPTAQFMKEFKINR